MKIHIKSIPQDFNVEEIADLNLIPTGSFAVYKLYKKGWNTVDALLEIAKELNIPFKLIAYGGKKDRHAQTVQYFTIEAKRYPDVKRDNFRSEFVGFTDRAMGPDLIEANQFSITIRQLQEEQVNGLIKNLKLIESTGYINYFDDQRFGSWDPLGGFLAEKILKEHYNKAIKIYLTAIHHEEKSGDKARKQFFVEHWGKWDVCLKEARTAVERKAFSDLNKKIPKTYEGILNSIPKEDLSMAVSAFQSFLWNELVRRILKKKADTPLVSFKGKVGDYIFFTRLDKMPYDYLKKLKIQTVAHNAHMPDKLTDIIYAQLLKEHEILPNMFAKIKIRNAFFKAFDRAVVIKPKDLSWQKGDKSLTLNFTLPKGCYATILIKRLFCS